MSSPAHFADGSSRLGSMPFWILNLRLVERSADERSIFKSLDRYVYFFIDPRAVAVDRDRQVVSAVAAQRAGNLRVALDEDRNARADEAAIKFPLLPRSQFPHSSRALLPGRVRNLVGEPGRRSRGADGVREDVKVSQRQRVEKFHLALEDSFALAGESDDDIAPQGGVRQQLARPRHDVPVIRRVVVAAHLFQDPIVAR